MALSRKTIFCVVITLTVLIFLGYYISCLGTSTSDITRVLSSRINPRSPSLPEVHETYAERARLLQRGCKAGINSKQKLPLPSEGERIYVSDRYSLGYCNVPKVGSTFWFATFAILDGNVTYTKSPQAVVYKLIDEVQTKVAVKKYHRLSFSARQELNKNGLMFLYARDPYERLLSAYVNKFLSPNAYYWGSFGKQIVTDFRPRALESSKKCGHDVTFPEFLRFVAESSTADPHWLPIQRICSPCQHPYKFIGKAETFEKDTLELLRRANISAIIQYNPVRDQQVILYMQTKISQFLEQYPNVNHCLTFRDLIERLWLTFKAKGYIDMDVNIPKSMLIDDADSAEKLKTRLLDAAFDVYKSAYSNSQIYNFGRKFMETYYARVDLTVLRKIQHKFWGDFALFGYDPEPVYLFYRSSAVLLLILLVLVIAFFTLLISRSKYFSSYFKVKIRY